MKKLLLLSLLFPLPIFAALENDLYDAVNRGDTRACADLLNRGADINARAVVNGNRYLIQPLLLAAQRGDVQMMAFLIGKGANANAVVFGGENALFYALLAPAEKRGAAVRYLTDHTNIDVNCVAKSGETPIMRAQKVGDTALVQHLQRLSSRRPASPTVTQNSMQLKLRQAVLDGDLPMCRKLIAAGATCSGPVDAANGRPLLNAYLTACLSGQLEIVQYFVKEGGAHVQDKAIQQQNALMFAVQAPADKRYAVFEWLLENTDLDACYLAGNGKSAMTLAQDCGADDIVTLIKNHAAAEKHMEEERAAECPVSLSDIKKQQEKVDHYSKLYKKELKQYESLLKSSSNHQQEAAAWDEVSREVGGLTRHNESRRQNEHRKARNEKNRATAVAKQRIERIKDAYQRELFELKKMVSVYNQYHPRAPYLIK